MGVCFFIQETSSKKIRLNLSYNANDIIKQDIKNFYLNESKETTSGFLNKIVANFYQNALASVNQRLEDKIFELDDFFSKSEFNSIKQSDINIITKALLANYKETLINKTLSYDKGVNVNMDINKSNIDHLTKDIHEADIYNSESKYIKTLLEEYSMLEAYKREQVFFNDEVEKINSAINNNVKLKLTIKQKFRVKDTTFYKKSFYVTPYKLVQDRTNSYNYLVGYSEEINEDNTLKNVQISSFRLSQISYIDVYNSKKKTLSKDEKNAIEEVLRNNTVQYMSSPIMDIKVRFTKKGLEKYQRIIYLRPNNYTRDIEDNMIYTFHCTKKHFMDYFIKFLRDIEVLEPLYLREQFIKWYKDAVSVYEKEN